MKIEKYTEGNIALLYGVEKELTVHDIFGDYNTRVLSKDGKGSIEPIKLTEELFIKGGIKKESSGHFLIELDMLTYLEIIPSEGRWFPWINQSQEMGSSELDSVSLNCIDHLHELQTLLKTLSGEELKINIE